MNDFPCDRVPTANSLVHLLLTLAFCSLQAPWGRVQPSSMAESPAPGTREWVPLTLAEQSTSECMSRGWELGPREQSRAVGI